MNPMIVVTALVVLWVSAAIGLRRWRNRVGLRTALAASFVAFSFIAAVAGAGSVKEVHRLKLMILSGMLVFLGLAIDRYMFVDVVWWCADRAFGANATDRFSDADDRGPAGIGMFTLRLVLALMSIAWGSVLVLLCMA